MRWVVQKPQKLVPFLQGQLGDYSGKFLRKILEANLCKINGRIERFGSKLLSGGEIVELARGWNEETKPKQTNAIFEDADLLIIDKPVGWVCDPKTVEKTFGGGFILVHRLDKGTSGLLILAKNKEAKEHLVELFKKKQVYKSYLALVDGIPKDQEGIRSTFFQKKRSFSGQTIWGSSPNGLEAITKWKKLKEADKISLILCEPITGRTHQIRVHMAEMGHPIITDPQYAKSYRSKLICSRPMLHAYQLRFVFKGKEISVQSQVASDFQKCLLDVGIDFVAH